MPQLPITTPRGVVYTVTGAHGKVVAKIEWDPDFGKKRTGYFARAQKFVDSEVLRFCSSRVPLRTGMLQKSGLLGTVVGSGEVRYVAPYAAHQNYNTAQSRPYDANRGARWFERGKIAERSRILLGAKRIAGGG